VEIPLNAQVECTDGVCGHSVYVLINPVIDQVTHLIVKEDTSFNTEYIVPVDLIVETITDTIQLRCSKAELEKMDPFNKTRYIGEKVHGENFAYSGMYRMGSYSCKNNIRVRGISTDPAGGTGCVPWYPCRGHGWLCWSRRRIRGQPGERPHYPFGDAGRTSVGTEGCNHSSFSDG
jgi:hypothetical protein